MSPALPGALIERERICDECSCPSADCEEVEISRGSATRLLCADCRIDHAAQIADARAYRAAGQCDEDAAREE